MLRNFLLFIGLVAAVSGKAQRVYAPHSVLASGSWFRVGVTKEGVYKIDVAMLNTMGVNTTNLASASIQLYGNGGGMLDENIAGTYKDDLVENAIAVEDGGDGILDGNDYILFYAPGTSRWEKDSLQQQFRHRKNLYNDTAFYYLTTGGTGKRIQPITNAYIPTVTVSSYNERYFYENDLVNLLSSGKEWYGEEFSNNPGSSPSRAFNVDWTGLLTSQPLTLVSDVAGRSVGGNGQFTVTVNGQPVQVASIPGVSGYFLDHYATAATQQNSFTVNQGTLNLVYSYAAANANAEGWLNWFELHGRKSLAVNNNTQFFFRDWQSVASNAVAGFNINTNGVATTVWDITATLTPVKMNVTVNGTQAGFANDASILHEYVAFNNTNLLKPVALGKVENQDLHHSTTVDYLIISHPSLLPEARRLAQFHEQQDGMRTAVVTTTQLFHEFGSGIADPTAIRDFVKMYVDKAGADTTKRPQYLLLFGSASYDYKNRVKNNTNMVPCYESANSLDPLSSYTSDDFFALPGGSPGLSGIAVGRIPARTLTEAQTMVDKIIRYRAKESFGSWRNEMVFVADDGDQNLHLNDAEVLTADAQAINPIQNQQKIYLDSYPVTRSSGGARYPAVNDAIVNRLYNGALIFNYSGHGSYQRLAEEAVFSQDEVNRLNNPNKLPLFITASCDFAPFDDPQKNSLGAAVLTGTANGAIALLTTTRLVFAYSNRIINDNYLRIALQPDTNGKYLSLGEAVRRAKNLTIQSFGDVLNTRKFALLGDPALRLAIPSLQLQLRSLNNQSLTGKDTLHALTAYTITGIVADAKGNTITDFNGTVYPTIFDQPQGVQTLGNDPSSIVTRFQQQTNILYKGNATVTNGQFKFSFILPKDISFQPGRGRISLYAADSLRDASGVYTAFYTGGNSGVTRDITGPDIRLYLNDEQFLNGGLTNENPVLLAKLFDSSGINTSGNGIGHDITAVIDGNESNIVVLNDYYTTERDNYRKGTLRYQLPTLTEGKHRLKLKAWDVADNSGEATLDFTVVKQAKLKITNLRNYPNPFTNSTTFSFEHNQPGAALSVEMGIYQSTGRLVKRLRQMVGTAGTRNCQLTWDGTDEQGRKLEKGVYIYRIVITLGNERFEEARQLILF